MNGAGNMAKQIGIVGPALLHVRDTAPVGLKDQVLVAAIVGVLGRRVGAAAGCMVFDESIDPGRVDGRCIVGGLLHGELIIISPLPDGGVVVRAAGIAHQPQQEVDITAADPGRTVGGNFLVGGDATALEETLQILVAQGGLVGIVKPGIGELYRIGDMSAAGFAIELPAEEFLIGPGVNHGKIRVIQPLGNARRGCLAPAVDLRGKGGSRQGYLGHLDPASICQPLVPATVHDVNIGATQVFEHPEDPSCSPPGRGGVVINHDPGFSREPGISEQTFQRRRVFQADFWGKVLPVLHIDGTGNMRGFIA